MHNVFLTPPSSKKRLFYCRNKYNESVLHFQNMEFVPLTISYHLYFLRIFKVEACYITGRWGEFRVKNATLCLHILFWLFFIKKLCFYIFISVLIKYQTEY